MTKGLQELISSKVAVPPPFSLDREPLGGGATVVTVRGELDMLTVPELRSALNEEIDRGVSRLVLDLSEVSFIDSVSLAAIVNAHRRCERFAVVIEEGSYAMLIFEIGGLDSVVELFYSRADAAAQLQA